MTEPALNGSGVPDEFNLDNWIDGTCGLIRTARIFQRGDLFARLDELERERELAKKVPKADRGVDDRAPESVQDEIDELSALLLETAITVHVQDRTSERRRKIRDRLKKQGLDPDKEEDADTVGLHILADAIVKVETADGKVKDFPDGFPPEKLRAMQDRLGDAALFDAWNAHRKVTMEAPSVAAPLSRRSSSNPGGIT